MLSSLTPPTLSSPSLSHTHTHTLSLSCLSAEETMASFPVSSRRTCQICGDDVGSSSPSCAEPFVACVHCSFPVCRPCYEYERKDGNQACPHCKNRYIRHKGELSLFSVFCVSLLALSKVILFFFAHCCHRLANSSS